MRRKVVHFLRHGQATHNVRAEVRRAQGCTFQEFLDQMAQDDEFDADLTLKGRAQAQAVSRASSASWVQSVVELVVASPLSRAVDTAELVLPRAFTPNCRRRVIREEWREVNGLLLNGQRRSRYDLVSKYMDWDVELSAETDTLWTSELEPNHHAAQRAYEGLCWLWAREEEHIVVAAHGGIFHAFLNTHPYVHADPLLAARFHNCELRSCEMSLLDMNDDDTSPVGVAHAHDADTSADVQLKNAGSGSSSLQFMLRCIETPAVAVEGMEGMEGMEGTTGHAQPLPSAL